MWPPGCGVSLSLGVFNYLQKDDMGQQKRSKKGPFQKSSAHGAAAGLKVHTSCLAQGGQTLPPSALIKLKKNVEFIAFWNKELMNTFGWETQNTCKPEGSMNAGAIEHRFR